MPHGPCMNLIKCHTQLFGEFSVLSVHRVSLVVRRIKLVCAKPKRRRFEPMPLGKMMRLVHRWFLLVFLIIFFITHRQLFVEQETNKSIELDEKKMINARRQKRQELQIKGVYHTLQVRNFQVLNLA